MQKYVSHASNEMLGVSIGNDCTIFAYISMPPYLEHIWNITLNPKLHTNL